jgi:HlyD family type I secretion membrane fusion protein
MTMSKIAPPPPTNDRAFLIAGYATVGILFGGLGTWAAVANVSSAAVAPGLVSVETNRKAVQHYEGGIVDDILVRENQRVSQGDVLVRLRPTQATANAEIFVRQLDATLALEARLAAERDQLPSIIFPQRLLDRRGAEGVQRIMDDQVTQFKERRGSVDSQIQILQARIDQTSKEIQGLEAQEVAVRRQLDSLQEEVDRVRPVAEKGFFPFNRLMAMERDISNMTGRQGQLKADISKAHEVISETRLQIIQIRQKFSEDVLQRLQETRAQIGDLEEKSRVAQDVLQRIDVRASQAGVVQNIKVHTQGGVIRAGDTIMEIVPIGDTLNIQARVSPLDINYVVPGLEAEVKFPSFRSRNLPLMFGSVKTVGADALFDEASKQSYYLAIIEVRQDTIPEFYRERMTAGMPADVMINLGDRTVLDYLTSPLVDGLAKSFREK